LRTPRTTWPRACARRASRPSAWCWPRALGAGRRRRLLSAGRAQRHRGAAQATEGIARRDDAAAIDAAVEALAEGTEAFAAARMNQGIRQALAGRRSKRSV
jgi:hypothetical protein